MINIAKIILPIKMDMILITRYEKSKIIYGLYIGLHWIDGDHSNKILDCFRIVQSTTLSATLSSTLGILVNPATTNFSPARSKMFMLCNPPSFPIFHFQHCSNIVRYTNMHQNWMQPFSHVKSMYAIAHISWMSLLPILPEHLCFQSRQHHCSSVCGDWFSACRPHRHHLLAQLSGLMLLSDYVQFGSSGNLTSLF